MSDNAIKFKDIPAGTTFKGMCEGQAGIFLKLKYGDLIMLSDPMPFWENYPEGFVIKDYKMVDLVIDCKG